MKDLKSLKDMYQAMRKIGDKETTEFLDGIVSYCEYIKFTLEETKIMLEVVMNILPEAGQKFTECNAHDHFGQQYINKLEEKNE
jgi:hypothetical protein